MALVQTEPKKIYIGSTEVKKITMRPNGTEKQIRPVYKREPWANTIAYRPLTDNYNDYSWNGYNITSPWSTTLITLNWVKCLSLSGWICQVSNIDTLTNYSNYTMSVWARLTTNDMKQIGWNFSENWSWGWGWITLATTDSYAQIRWGNTTNRYSAYTWTSPDIWFHFVLTVLNGEWSIYVNWNKTVLIGSWVGAPNHNGTPMYIGANESWWAQNDGYVSQMIIEKQGWTQQEVLDYYNWTKWNYWL